MEDEERDQHLRQTRALLVSGLDLFSSRGANKQQPAVHSFPAKFIFRVPGRPFRCLPPRLAYRPSQPHRTLRPSFLSHRLLLWNSLNLKVTELQHRQAR